MDLWRPPPDSRLLPFKIYNMETVILNFIFRVVVHFFFTSSVCLDLCELLAKVLFSVKMQILSDQDIEKLLLTTDILVGIGN